MPKNRQNPKKVLIFQKKCCKIKTVSRDGAAWSARLAHNQEVVGSNPTPATKKLCHKKPNARGLFLFGLFDSAGANANCFVPTLESVGKFGQFVRGDF